MASENTPLLPDPEIRYGPINEGIETTELRGCGASICCNPHRAVHRFIVLIFMCLLGFGSYFCYDNPGTLQEAIQSDMDVSTSTYMGLYAWYSYPNIILCFFGGFLIDRVFGIRAGTIIFAAFVLLGQIIFASGALANRFWLMDFGRFIFGVGGESLAVAQNTYAVSWFKDKELNMVFGLQLSLARLGSSIGFIVMGSTYSWVNTIYQGYTSLGVALMIAGVTCVMSFASSLILGYLDRRAEKILNKRAGETGEVIRIQDVKDFPASLWLISLICVAYYVAVLPFIGLGTVLFERKFGFAPQEARTLISMVYIISAITSPCLGFGVDVLGRNIYWVFGAILATLGAHALLGFTFLSPYVSMSILGLSYAALASALWPMVALVIPEHQLGTAYGIMQSVQNGGLGLVSQVSGMIVDAKGYLVLEVFFQACVCVALIAAVMLWLLDANRGGRLNMSAAKRKRMDRELEAAETLEREKLFASGSMADVTPQDLLQSRSDFSLRNRYLSRLGAPLPSSFDITLCALIHRTGLK